MKGYKAFNADLTCRDFQYEVGKTYETDKQIGVCHCGFHFCKNLADVYNYYPASDDTRICEVVALGEVEKDGDKYVTNKIKIGREIKSKAIKHGNTDKSEVGYFNSGNKNSGWRNSGDCNSGHKNSGHYNSGYWNSGNWNSGDWNSGNFNSGNGNSGCWNSGYKNSGYWNSGNWSSGVFNTDQNPKIKMFDKDSEWTMDKWKHSDACEVLQHCPHTHSDFISEHDMTDEEKENHPEYKTIGGYIKTIVATKYDKKKWYDGLPEEDKEVFRQLPNYDEKKFFKCIGIPHIPLKEEYISWQLEYEAHWITGGEE